LKNKTKKINKGVKMINMQKSEFDSFGFLVILQKAFLMSSQHFLVANCFFAHYETKVVTPGENL